MDYSTIIAFACLIPASFALGWFVRHRCEGEYEARWKYEAETANRALSDLVGGCRKTLSDAWLNRVMRNWSWRFGRYGNLEKDGGAK